MANRPPHPIHHRSGRRDEQPITIHLEDEKRLTYAEYGCPGGVPVVFLHGTPGSRRLGRVFERVARDCGVRVLAVDRPGYGRSTPWPTSSIRDACRFVTAVLDDVGVHSAGLIAFSGASPYALAAVATFPERLTRVDVVAGATPPTVSKHTPVTQRLLATMATRTPSVLRGLLRGQAWLANRLDPSFVVSQYASAGTLEAISGDVAESVRDDFLEAFDQSTRGAVIDFRRSATDWELDFDQIETPVHFWHGDSDANVPIEDARRFATRLSAARLHVLDDADHLQTLLQSVPDILEEYR